MLQSTKSNMLKKEVSFQVETTKSKLQWIQEEYITFCLKEHYGEGQDILVCSAKIKVSDVLKRTSRFLFDLTSKEKVLGHLKIGRITRI